jgi:prefoldin subunit 5
MSAEASQGNRILSIRAKNVKKIREVFIDDVGDIHEVRGDTDQGKTSILDSIEGCLRGMDKSMVSRGADKAELELVMTEATVKRIVSAGEGSDTLMVTGADGKAVERAKDFLRTICGGEAFRPLTWVQLGGGDKKGSTERRRLQRDQLLESLDVSLDAEKVMAIIGAKLGEDHLASMDQVSLGDVDFDQHPFVVVRAILSACKEFFTFKNAEKDRAEEVLRNTPAPEIAAPKSAIEECRKNEAAAVAAYHEANAFARHVVGLRERRAKLAATIEATKVPDVEKVAKARAKYGPMVEQTESQIKELEAQLEDLRADLKATRESMAKVEGAERTIRTYDENMTDLTALDEQLAIIQGGGDLGLLQAAMQNATALCKARELQDRHDEAAAVAIQAAAHAKRFKDLVELFRDGIPKLLLEEADLPVEGLTIDEDTILIDGVPLHQLGTSRQIRLGVLIAHALNPRSAFVLVDGAESMGSKDRKALADTAAELGLQLIMTIVDPDAVPAQGVTVMRDGEKVA